MLNNDLTAKYILDYTKGFVFNFSEHVKLRISSVDIDVDIFEYNDQYNYREKAHVVFKKNDLTYVCDCCDKHNYETDFFPIVLNDRSYICFRKTLYGFTLINTETLDVEFEYFPEIVHQGEESFIITDVKQIEDLLIFEGCYWACPYECIAFDYTRKQFLNVSKMCKLLSLDEARICGDTLILSGTDKDSIKKQIAVSKQDIILGMNIYGQSDFDSDFNN